MAGARYPAVTGTATVASPGYPTTVAQEASSVVSFPANAHKCCGNRKNSGNGRRQTALGDMEKQGLFSTGAGSEESPPESEPQVLFSVTFIHYKVLIFPCKHPKPPPFQADSVSP